MGVFKCAQCLSLGGSVVGVLSCACSPTPWCGQHPPHPLPPTFLGLCMQYWGTEHGGGARGAPGSPPTPLFPPQGEGLHQLREALKILAERVLILETMIGLYGE